MDYASGVHRPIIAICAAVLVLWPSPGSTATQVVEVGDDYFDGKIVRVGPGTTVTFRSIGLLTHTVTADDGSFHSSDLTRGKSFRHRFDQPGVYRYFCIYHGATRDRGMAGTVLVGDVDEPTPQPPHPPRDTPEVIRVPADHPTIQRAVDAARPGDMVLISEGVYTEAVVVDTPQIVIRGVDRHDVVIDGEFARANGFLVDADRVAIENLTARNHTVNGFYWAEVKGYRGSYLNAIRNGDYGIYVIGSRFGLLDHVYTAGSPDGGIYIGACFPCDALVTDSLSEFNELGFSGTNAGGRLVIADSEWRNNHTGILPNTLDSEHLAPQRQVTIRNNLVHSNGDDRAPFKKFHLPALGAGIALVGTRDDLVVGNHVYGNRGYGILVMPSADLRFWMSKNNSVVGNRVSGSSKADLALTAPSAGGDCFLGNRAKTSLPFAIESRLRCGSMLSKLGGGDLAVGLGRLALLAKGSSDRLSPPSYRSAPHPGLDEQPDMPASSTQTWTVPALNNPAPEARDPVWQADGRSRTEREREVHLAGIGATPDGFALFLGLYAYALPMALYGTWMALSIWDLARRQDVTAGRRVLLAAAVMIVPFAGPAGYLLFGRVMFSRGLAITVVAGGVLLFAALAALSMFGSAL